MQVCQMNISIHGIFELKPWRQLNVKQKCQIKSVFLSNF